MVIPRFVGVPRSWDMRRRTRRLKTDLARALRKRQTAAECIAWDLLRDRRCLGFKFRRQYVIRGFIADFYCADCGW